MAKLPFIAREKITNIGTGANLDNPTKMLSIRYPGLGQA